MKSVLSAVAFAIILGEFGEKLRLERQERGTIQHNWIPGNAAIAEAKTLLGQVNQTELSLDSRGNKNLSKFFSV